MWYKLYRLIIILIVTKYNTKLVSIIIYNNYYTTLLYCYFYNKNFIAIPIVRHIYNN